MVRYSRLEIKTSLICLFFIIKMIGKTGKIHVKSTVPKMAKILYEVGKS